MLVRKSAPLILTCTLTAVLSACGGGSSGSASNTPTATCSTVCQSTATVDYTANYVAGGTNTVSNIQSSLQNDPATPITQNTLNSFSVTNGSFTSSITATGASSSNQTFGRTDSSTAVTHDLSLTLGPTTYTSARYGIHYDQAIVNAQKTEQAMPFFFTSSTTAPTGAYTSSTGGILAHFVVGDKRDNMFQSRGRVACSASSTLTVSGGTTTYVLTPSSCAYTPSSTTLTASGSITFTSTDNVNFTTSGNFRLQETGGTDLQPTAYFGKLAFTGTNGREVVGRVLATQSDSNAVFNLAFGTK